MVQPVGAAIDGQQHDETGGGKESGSDRGKKTGSRAAKKGRQARLQHHALREESIFNNALMAALRQNGCFMPKEAEYAIFETTGKISVRRRGRAGHCAPNDAPLAG